VCINITFSRGRGWNIRLCSKYWTPHLLTVKLQM